MKGGGGGRGVGRGGGGGEEGGGGGGGGGGGDKEGELEGGGREGAYTLALTAVDGNLKVSNEDEPGVRFARGAAEMAADIAPLMVEVGEKAVDLMGRLKEVDNDADIPGNPTDVTAEPDKQE